MRGHLKHRERMQPRLARVAGRGLPVAFLEPYANPLLNFIFLIPLIRSGGIMPAGKNPCSDVIKHLIEFHRIPVCVPKRVQEEVGRRRYTRLSGGICVWDGGGGTMGEQELEFSCA